MHSHANLITNQHFFEQYAEAILITSANRKAIYVNAAFTELTGYSIKELSAEMHGLFGKAVNQKTKYFESDLACKNETLIHVKISSSKIVFSDQSEGRVYTLRENSEEAKLKEAQTELANLNKEFKRSNEELEQFAYVASHDLQEPLRTISGYIQLIQKQIQRGNTEGINDFMGFAVEGVSRAQALISDLLQFSRVSRKGNPFAETDLSEVLNIAITHLSVKIKELEATVTFEKLPRVRGDSSQLTRLFQNLIDNAMKFRAQGRKPEVKVYVKEQEEMYLFAVADNGIGIENKFYNRIFAIFQRLHTRTEYEGTGIGLAVCKKIVERHGGEIWVESEPGVGSTFYFTIKKQLI